jgi:hypothetical protein
MPNFPRVGFELSTQANVRLSTPEHDRPAFLHRFENGSREARFRTSHGTVDFVVTFIGPEPDTAVMIEFFDTVGVVVPFTIIHPRLGSGNAYLKLTRHRIEDFVKGTPFWSRIEIPIEGAF